MKTRGNFPDSRMRLWLIGSFLSLSLIVFPESVSANSKLTYGGVSWDVATTSGMNTHGYGYTWSPGSIIWRYAFSASPGWAYVFAPDASLNNDYIFGSGYYPTENSPDGIRPLGGPTGSLAFMSGKSAGNYNVCIYNGGTFSTADPVGTNANAWFQYYWDGSAVSTSTPPATMISGNITSTTTWSGLYIVSGNVHVNSGVTLTILPGTSVAFDVATTSSLTINGTLNSIGDENSSSKGRGDIFLSSTNDNFAGGGEPGEWGGIVINSGGIVNLDHTIIRFAGSANVASSTIYNNGGTLNASNSSLAFGSTYGLRNVAGTATLTNSEFAFHEYGVYADGGDVSVIEGNIHDNSSYGIFNTTGNVISAEDSWWGSSSGPYNSLTNPFGTGNGVSSNVDFNPWRTSLHYVLGSGQGSVNGWTHELRWTASTTYSGELSAAISTWNSLGEVNIVENVATTTNNLDIYEVSEPDVGWAARWDNQPNPDVIRLNTYFLSNISSSAVQSVLTHELGHALELGHSYVGNIMYLYTSDQTTLGNQDIFDYYYKW